MDYFLFLWYKCVLMKKNSRLFCITVISVFLGINIFLSLYEFNQLIYFCTVLIAMYAGSVFYLRLPKVPNKNKKRVNKVVSSEPVFNAGGMNPKISDLNVVFHDFKNDLDIEMVSSTSMHVDQSSVGKLEVTSKFVKLLYDPKQLPSNFLNFN